MGTIDVSDILCDPDFIDKIQIISRTPGINSLGENFLTEVSSDTVGSVQPASGKVLQRLPEALRLANVRSFWIRGQIRTAGDGSYPDLLVFKGQRFQVQTVNDWSNWGEGWSEGTCIAEAIA